MKIRIERNGPAPMAATVECGEEAEEDFANRLAAACPGGFAELVSVVDTVTGETVAYDLPCSLVGEDAPGITVWYDSGPMFEWLTGFDAVTVRPLAPGDRIVFEAE